MAKLTVKIIGDNSDALKSIDIVQRKLDDLGKNPVEIKIDAIGNTDLLKQLTKLEQAKASTARANAKIAESEAKVKIARQQTKTVTAQATLEEKKAETAKKQSTLETKKATTAEKQREAAVAKGEAALKQKALQEERTNTKTAEAELVEKKAAAAAEKRAASEKQAATATKELGTATQQTAKQTETLWDNFQKFARWYIVGGAFTAIVRSMREALDTMKAVDDELVTIRKVTGFSDAQISGIREQAYSTASAYGVGAADYLESVAAFSRAGYKEQSAALAELSTKTQIVGDTTAEVANQFLLSVDAAYQYKGSIEALTAVLDGANEIDNKYATSIEKIAEGMGIVAPVAAQMHVTVGELAAAIGTITAVTQRTGSEAARALRALMLNIVGDTKTEIDEGVTWTTGEIAGLRDVIKQYAPEAYKAAQATGAIIDPMEAIGGLAKSMQEGLLTEQRLMEMVSDIGGKLRTSQLLALIQNWDMYQSMLTDYASAIGSADKEVENALDSWTRKTEQLRNAWAEFISHLIDTKEIKVALDALTGAVKILDSGFGRFTVTLGLCLTAVKLLSAASGALGTKIKTAALSAYFGQEAVAALTAEELAATAATVSLGDALATLGAAMLANPVTWIIGAAAALYGLYELSEALTVTYDEQREKLEELQSQYDALHASGSELEQLKSATKGLTEEEEKRLGVLQAQSIELEKQLRTQKQKTFEAWREEQAAGIEWYQDDVVPEASRFINVNLTEKALSEASTALADIEKQARSGVITYRQYEAAVSAVIASIEDEAEAIQLGVDAGMELTDTEQAVLDLYNFLTGALGRMTEKKKEDTQATEENADATEDAADANELLQKAFEEVDKKGNLTYGTLAALEKLYPGLSAKILDANGNLTAEGKAALSTRASLYELISTMISANTTALNFDGQIAELQRLASEAGIAAGMITAVFSAANMSAAGTGDWDEIANMTPDEVARYRVSTASNQTLALIRKKIKDASELTGPGGGGGGGSKAKTEEELIAEAQQEEINRLKNIVALRKQELSFIQESGGSTEEQIAKMREVQDALHVQAEYMRQNAAYQSAIAKQEQGITELTADEISALKEVNALSTDWWTIQNKILDTTKKTAETLKNDIGAVIDAFVDRLTEVNDAQIAALEAERDALEEQHDAAEDTREEEEKRLAIAQARIALENAQRERTVRQYNAATGQWEWVADAKNVLKAQEDLAKAEAEYTKYKEEQAYKTRLAEIEAELSQTKNVFDSVKDAMKRFSEAIKNILESPVIDAQLKEKFVADITNILTAPNLPDDVKLDFINAVTDILTVPELDDQTKAKFLSNLTDIFNNDALSAQIKGNIAQAISALLGTDGGPNAAQLFYDFINAALTGAKNPQTAIAELTDAILSGAINLNSISDILDALNGKYDGISRETAAILALTKMQANSIAWHMTSDPNEQARLHDENVALGNSLGLEYDPASGTWMKNGQAVYSLSNIGGDWVSTLSEAIMALIESIRSESGSSKSSSGGATDIIIQSHRTGTTSPTPSGGGSSANTQNSGTSNTSGSGSYQKKPRFDSGGILKGVGGIKATEEDEIVLPPDITSNMLTAQHSGGYDALLSSLGIVTGAATTLVTTGKASTRSSIGSQHNGDIYEIEGVTLSEAQARSMTVYDLAQMGRALALHKGG